MRMTQEMRIEKRDLIWRDGVMGVVVGDALGCPVQFRDREEIARHPVTTMIGHGTYNMPVGTWTDDSSLTLALLSSIRENGDINLPDIMNRFVLWLTKGEYTPFGEAFDIGQGTIKSIRRYMKNPDTESCGGRTEYDNGNGSLMRILPVCLYCYEKQEGGVLTDEEAIQLIHKVSGLTHNHLRASMACGLYYFMIRRILRDDGPLIRRLQDGIDDGFAFYKKDAANLTELPCYGRLHNLYKFAETTVDQIRSTGYVVDSLEAAVWSLLITNTFQDAALTAVNLGDDTDSVTAIAGGLAGLFYGYEDIPEEWLAVIQKRSWVEALCIR